MRQVADGKPGGGAVGHSRSIGRTRARERVAARREERFRGVAKVVGGIAAKSAVLDGEVVAVDAEGRPSFQVLQNRGRLPAGYRLTYYVFDLLFLNGKDLTGKPLVERREQLPGIIEGTALLFSAPLEGSPKVLIEAVRKHKLEGIVAKRGIRFMSRGGEA